MVAITGVLPGGEMGWPTGFPPANRYDGTWGQVVVPECSKEFQGSWIGVRVERGAFAGGNPTGVVNNTRYTATPQTNIGAGDLLPWATLPATAGPAHGRPATGKHGEE